MRTKNYVHKREREGREKDLLTLYATALCPTTRPNTMRIDLTLRAIRPTLLVKKILRYCLRERGCSFNGDTLCQVSGEVDVDASQDGNVVAEQLHGDDGQEALQTVDGLRHSQDPRRVGRRQPSVAFIRDHNRGAFTRRHLLQSRLDLGVKRILRHDQNDRHIFVNQSQRSMF